MRVRIVFLVSFFFFGHNIGFLLVFAFSLSYVLHSRGFGVFYSRMTEDATNGNTWPPDTRATGVISRAAFEVDDYWRIVEILHSRFNV